MSLIETFSSRGDVADLLPERAREKYISLRQQADDEHARLSPVLQQIAEVRNDRQTLAGRLKRLTDPRATGGFGLDETEIQTRDVQAKVGKFDAEIARLSELQQVRSFRWRERAGLIQNVEAYITQGRPRGTIFSPVATEPPTVKKGESVIDAIEGRRRRLREIAADIHRVQSAAIPSAVAKAKILAQVERLAESGRPSLEGAISYGADAEFPTLQLQAQVHLPTDLALAFTEVPDSVGMICWVLRDQLIARLNADIDQISDDENALSDEQRENQLAELQGDALACGRHEEALIESAERQGLDVLRRPDADALAVLSLELVTPSRTSATPIASSVRK